MLAVAALFGAAAMAFGRVENLLWLTLGFAALRFLGQGSLMLSCANLVAQWFDAKRGSALSLMALGFSASMAVHPPLAQWLTEQMGWRAAWLWLGVLTWLLLIPPILLLVQNKPEDMGLQPDGNAGRDGGSSGAAASPQGAEVGLTVKEAVRTSAFWITALSLATLSMLVTALFFHQVSIFTAQGVDPHTAARVFSASAITMVLAMPLIGRLLDRFPTKPIFAGAMLTQSAALIAICSCTISVRRCSTRSSSASTMPPSRPTTPTSGRASSAGGTSAASRAPPRPSAWSAPRLDRYRSARRSICSATMSARSCS